MTTWANTWVCPYDLNPMLTNPIIREIPKSASSVMQTKDRNIDETDYTD
jgi:hypothetical protein